MKKTSAVALAVLFVSVFFCGGSEVFAGKDSEGWTSLREDVYINRKSIAHPSGHTVSLWVKIIPDRGSDLFSETQEQLRAKGKDLQANAYEYTGFLSEIDCAKKRNRKLTTILYDINKNIIQSVDHSAPSWVDTVPESSFDLVQMAVCAQAEDIAANLP